MTPDFFELRGGFNTPIAAGDKTVAELLEKYGLPNPVSLAQIEPVAMRLLDNPSPSTALETAELVLNRRVDGQERDIARLIVTPGFTGGQRFGLLLLARTTEEL